MRFTTGDVVVHPVRGAGIVERIVERVWQGNAEMYYRIKLLGQSGTTLTIPASVADEMGVRCAIAPSDLGQLWCVLLSAPGSVPDEPKELRQFLQDKLGTGDIYLVAEVVRDMAWRQCKSHLTAAAKQLYEDGVRLLVGEIAATQGVAFGEVETQFRTRLREHLSSATAV